MPNINSLLSPAKSLANAAKNIKATIKLPVAKEAPGGWFTEALDYGQMKADRLAKKNIPGNTLNYKDIKNEFRAPTAPNPKIGSEKTAGVEKVLPWALGAGGLALLLNSIIPRKSLPEKIYEDTKGSLKDMYSDVRDYLPALGSMYMGGMGGMGAMPTPDISNLQIPENMPNLAQYTPNYDMQNYTNPDTIAMPMETASPY